MGDAATATGSEAAGWAGIPAGVATATAPGAEAGQREDRYMHALGDPADIESILAARQQAPERSAGNSVALERIEELEARIAALEERLSRLEA